MKWYHTGGLFAAILVEPNGTTSKQASTHQYQMMICQGEYKVRLLAYSDWSLPVYVRCINVGHYGLKTWYLNCQTLE
jgi:hypothetical protein